MSIEKVFKRLVLADFLMCILLVFVGGYIGLEADIGIEESPWYISDTIAFIIFLVYLVNLYLLYKFKPIGKKIYIPLFVLSLLWVFADPSPDYSYITNLTYVLEGFGFMLSGMIIAMLYWSDITKKFEK